MLSMLFFRGETNPISPQMPRSSGPKQNGTETNIPCNARDEFAFLRFGTTIVHVLADNGSVCAGQSFPRHGVRGRYRAGLVGGGAGTNTAVPGHGSGKPKCLKNILF